MHKKFKVIYCLFIAALMITGCTEKQVPPYEFSGKELSKLTTAYLAGDSSAFSLIGTIFNNADPALIEINYVKIDSIYFNNNDIVYLLLVEAKNPVFNSFVMIDKKMNVLLKDHSLNGNLSSVFHMLDGRNLFIINESFRSKDTFNLERTSVYNISLNSAEMIFRSLTKFSQSNNNIAAKITSFTNEKIILNFKAENYPAFKNNNDEFEYDGVLLRYVSADNYLRNFAVSEISKYKGSTDIQEITDINSYKRIFSGLKNNMVHTEVSKEDYTLMLSDDWREFENFAITKFLSSEFRGSKFINDKLGANISIVKLPPKDSAEVYTGVNLINKDTYEHPVRFSEIQESGKHIIRFYEYSCKGERFILILEAPKFTYERNLEVYESITKSFKINC